MKVGILTFHHVTNYGAVLQAYALSKVIKEAGYDVEIIDYRPYKAVMFYLGQLYPIRLKQQRLNRHFLGNIVKSWKIRKFLLSKMRLSNNKFYTKAGLKNFNHSYDVVISGSDEIWNTESFRGFDASYFLDFVCDKATRKISYAASFGSTKTLGDNKNKICNLINSFNYVSVRESNSLQLIYDECGRQATKVLDPTFLISYEDIISGSKFEEQYILIYDNTAWTIEQENFVVSIAKAKKLTIVSIGFHKNVAQKNLIGVSPEEWINYFAKASYIITSTFHGAVFSINFKKPFTIFITEFKSNKINDLLTFLELESRIFSVTTGVESLVNQSSDIDYFSVYRKLEVGIVSSKNYLLEALNGKN